MVIPFLCCLVLEPKDARIAGIRVKSAAQRGAFSWARSGVVEKFGKSFKNALVFTGKIVDFPATLMTPEVFCALEPGLPAIS